MAGLPPPSVAVVQASRWRTESGRPHTTIVGKLTMAVRDDGKAALIQPSPLVPFDRIAADQRFVTEAGEMMPWSAVASVVVQDGPLRFTLYPEGQPIVITAPVDAPIGVSMSSPERSQLATRLPTRGPDAVLEIPDDIDGRFFVAAWPDHHFGTLRGEERFVLETAGWRARRKLPGFVIAVAIEAGGRQRLLELVPDMLVVSGSGRRISIVSRVAVTADATVINHVVVPIGHVPRPDHGDIVLPPYTDARHAPDSDGRATVSPPETENRWSFGGETMILEETLDIDAATLAAQRGLVPHFGLAVEAEPESDHPHLRHHAALPATPFDRGFAPVAVVPADGVTSTMTPQGEMEDALAAMRQQLRSEGAREPAPARPKPPAAAPIVAPPVPGAMAKPRFKRK